MRLSSLVALFAATALMGAPAFADDDDWLDDFETEESEDDDWERMDEGDSDIDMDADPDEADSEEEEGFDEDLEDDGFDLLEDSIEEDRIGGEGEDTAKIYRAAQDKAHDLGYEEELIFWGKYIEDYPNSIFSQQIEERIDVLANQLYGEEIADERDAPVMDAGRKEIRFASPLWLESIDPRTRIKAGFEWGFPSYFNLMADYEHQITRELSTHAGLRRRYTGWNIEFGGKWAMVKSARTRTLVTLLLDARVNTEPAYLGLRPVLAAGQRFLVPNTKGLDLQVQAGVDYEIRDPMRTFFIGGFNLFVWATENVGAFVETNFTLKPGPEGSYGNGKPFAFNVLTFGMRFKPQSESTHIAVGANVPYFNNFWGWHYGAVQADVLYYLDE